MSCWGRIAMIAALLSSFCVAQDAAKPALIPEWWGRQTVCTIPRAYPSAPRIDGNIGYKEWYHASAVDGFIDVDTGSLARFPVRTFVCWDDDFVYVAVRVVRPPLHPTPRATFQAGRHEHIWWKDDNIELVIRPGRREQGIKHFYALAANSVGAWSLMRGTLTGSGGDTSYAGEWTVSATRQGREHWCVEIAIPISSLSECERPGPGAVWFMDVMNQQVTPAKRMVDLGLVWNLGMHGYRCPVTPKFVFVENGPISRPHGVGRLSITERQKKAGEATIGSRMVFYNTGPKPLVLAAHVQLFRAAPKRPAGALDLFKAWDIVRQIRDTGKPWLDPSQEIQAFRSEADILRELNERFECVAERAGRITVTPGGETAGNAYYPIEVPIENGEYIVAWRYSDVETGEVLSRQVVPFAVLPQLQVSLRPYFLTHHKIRAAASLSNLAVETGDTIQFTLAQGKTVLDTQVSTVEPGAEEAHVYLECKELREAKEAVVTARLLRGDGAKGVSNSATITRPPTPAWFGNTIGRSQVVPPPFEPVRPDGELAATVWQRRIELGANGLPESIVSRGTEILARPVAFDTGGAEVSMVCSRGKLTDRDAAFSAEGTVGGVPARLDTTLHYDGTARFDLRLVPGAAPAILNRLVLEIPLRSEWASLATHHATWTDPRRYQRTGFSGSVEEWFAKYPDGAIPFSYAVFLGTEDRGVQWFCESDRGWSDADGERVVSISREGKMTVLRVAIIDTPVTLTEPWTLTFGLTVTPVKDTAACRRVVMASEGRLYDKYGLATKETLAFHDAYKAAGIDSFSIYMTDDNHFGCPRMLNPKQEAKVRAYVDSCRERGLRVTPYTGWGVNANIPHFATFGQEMLAEPVKNIGWGCFLHVHNQVLQDWWLTGAKYTIDTCGLYGVYGDGFSMSRLLQNELEGFAWIDSNGRPRGSYSIWAIREFIERLYVFCHVEASDPARVRNHYNEEIYCIGGFTDERVTGEGQYHAGETVLGVCSPEAFRANFMTHLNGVHTVGLWWNYHKLPVTRNEMHAMFLLHDVPMVVGGGIVRYYGNRVGYGRKARPWVRLHRIRTAFDGAHFTGYWQKPGIVCDPPGPLASTWVDQDRGRALVVVSNLPDVPWSGRVAFDRAKLGIPVDVEARDAMLDESLELTGNGLRIQIKPQRYRLIVFGDRIPLPENVRVENEDEE